MHSLISAFRIRHFPFYFPNITHFFISVFTMSLSLHFPNTTQFSIIATRLTLPHARGVFVINTHHSGSSPFVASLQVCRRLVYDARSEFPSVAVKCTTDTPRLTLPRGHHHQSGCYRLLRALSTGIPIGGNKACDER